MEFMRSGKYIYDVKLNAKEQKAFDMFSRRRLAEHTRQHELEIEAIVIRQLRRLTGWGGIKLKRFYMDFGPDLMRLCDHYEMEEVEAPWLCLQELKREGFDIEEWHRELYPNEKYEV